MASERQLELARRLALGEDGVSAMLAAGWPIETACWLGLDAEGYLAKGGITVDRSGKTVKVAIVDGLADVGPVVTDDNTAPASADSEPEAEAKRPRGRPRKEG